MSARYLLYLVFLISIADSQPFIIDTTSFVAYEVEAKILGAFTTRIIGVNRNIQGEISAQPEVSAELLIPVESFKSGITLRDENVANILQYREFPEISFRLVSINDKDIVKLQNEKSGKFPVIGELQVAGALKQFDFVIHFSKESPSKVLFKTQTFLVLSNLQIPKNVGLWHDRMHLD